MALDAHPDALIDALALMAAADIASLDNALIKRVLKSQGDLRTISSDALPALYIYRSAEAWTARPSNAARCEVTVTFQYLLPSTQTIARDARWGSLNAVWKRIGKSVLLGGSTLAVGALIPCGYSLVPNSIRLISSGYADNESESYPSFVGVVGFAESVQAEPSVAVPTVTITAVQDICGILQDDGTVVPQP